MRAAPAAGRGGRRGAPAAAVALLLALGAGACAQVDVPESLPEPTTTTAPPVEAPPPEPDCGNPAASLRPDGPAGTDVPAGSYMADIRERGRLRVGVDVGTLRLSSVDPLTGEFTGFDVDIAREVAAALFDDPDAVQFIGIPSSERENVLRDGDVDLVASSFTATCSRRQRVSFSSEYFRAGQRVLVRDDDPAGSLADLGERGAEVCVSAGSTAIANIQNQPEPHPEIVPAPQRADCLVRLQRGEADAMVTDDAILAGMAAQDPSLRIVGERLSTEPYALGLPPGHREWVRYVNAVLDDVRSSGRWEQLYAEHLADVLGPSSGPPAPVYED
ncbi:MAG TPA: glutamate ABC transporter substrate-binding protein [Acidimicrobiales bacterium]